jgi:predicted nucleic acid-binding protein
MNCSTWKRPNPYATGSRKFPIADQLLLDEVEARREAARRNLPFIGTLGVLREAARRDLLDLRATLAKLQGTTFYVDPALIRSLLEEDDRRRGRLS